MRSKLVALLFSDLGIEASYHSRPRETNDNPFSESQFRTFSSTGQSSRTGIGSLEHARGVSHDLFAWYNDEHHHSGLSPIKDTGRRALRPLPPRSSRSGTAPAWPPTRHIPNAS